MEIGVVGKPNVGKSTFFNASTLSGAQVANYPFTTVEANTAVGFVRIKCPDRELGLVCKPRSSKCIDGNRFVPVKMIDVAGLVPGAHEGRGLGNKFLDDLRQASALIHVVDASGGTDFEGNVVATGTHNPVEDVCFLEKEIELWFLEIFKRNWEKIARKIQSERRDFVKYFKEMFVGLGFDEKNIVDAIKASSVNPEKPADWSGNELFSFTKALRKSSKPMIIAANKTDVEISKENIEKLKKEFPQYRVIPTSSMGENILVTLAGKGVIKYLPGDSGYTVVDKGKIDNKYEKALEIIDKNVFQRFGNMGIQECINAAVFNVLGRVVVFPVEDESKFTDKDGNVLPDAFIMEKGSTPRDLAFRIHTEIGEGFIGVLDARTKRKISSDKELATGDIIKILTK